MTGGATEQFDGPAFEALQSRLSALWPALTLRTDEFDDRVALMVCSITVPDIPDSLVPLLPAFEERYLFTVLTLARAPRSRVVYITSSPLHERVLDYFIDLLPGPDRDSCRQRLTVLSIGDPSHRPLVEKILERPRFVERIRQAVGDPSKAILLPFISTAQEAELSVRLGIPLYGPDPRLSWLGTKSGSRETFAKADVAHPRGAPVADLEQAADVAATLWEDGCTRVVVKLDEGYAGTGNIAVDLGGAHDAGEVRRLVLDLVPEGDGPNREEFAAMLLEQGGGIVEEWLSGEEIASPSVQMRASPSGELEILSTHDQILGGPSGQSYVGCRFPADARYRASITAAARAIGRQLIGHGVIGRFAVDFVVVRSGDGWTAQAIEINLRNGGTTHPAVTLLALTDAEYDQVDGTARSRGIEKYYVATDHLQRPEYRSLTIDDILDLIAEESLGWDAEREVGVAFHLLSAVSVAGLLGVTSIGDSPDEAERNLRRTEAALDRAAGVGAGSPRGG